MRAILVACACAVALLGPAVSGGMAADTAAVLLEALPFVLLAVVAQHVLPARVVALVPYAGCGCGPFGARSLPAAVATAMAFGPWIAMSRVAAATILAYRSKTHHCLEASAFDDWMSIAPFALLSSGARAVGVEGALHALPPIAQIASGALLGIIAPCGLGAVALAGALHVQSPAAAFGVLATSGMLGVPHVHRKAHGSSIAYLLLGAACALAVALHGATLVHPRFIPALGASALTCFVAAVRTKRRFDLRATMCAAGMLAAVVVRAPAPQYRGSETTVSDLFPGERLSFTGIYVATASGAALERYEVTCCRIDARPISLALSARLSIR